MLWALEMQPLSNSVLTVCPYAKAYHVSDYKTSCDLHGCVFCCANNLLLNHWTLIKLVSHYALSGELVYTELGKDLF